MICQIHFSLVKLSGPFCEFLRFFLAQEPAILADGTCDHVRREEHQVGPHGYVSWKQALVKLWIFCLHSLH